MDRFIALSVSVASIPFINLKSNMDRFIDTARFEKALIPLLFKIQYG